MERKNKKQKYATEKLRAEIQKDEIKQSLFMHITGWKNKRNVQGGKKEHNLCWVISVINRVFRVLFDSIFD